MPLDLDDRSRALAASGPLAHANTGPGAFLYRAFDSVEDAVACHALQAEIWGAAFDSVPASLLRVAVGIGGLAIGAFDPHGRLAGFVFSLAGIRDGTIIHWSHMLGVREEARGAGVGRRLKELQRAELAHRGITRVLWTFDPLQARNAHLNFNRLGVRLVEYVENMYGITASPLHHGLATDRLVVMLPTSGTNPPPAPAGPGMNGATPVITPFPQPGDVIATLDEPNTPALRIEIPADLQDVMESSPALATTWRFATRAAFERALALGYEVTGLRRDTVAHRAFYTLIDRRQAPVAETEGSTDA